MIEYLKVLLFSGIQSPPQLTCFCQSWRIFSFPSSFSVGFSGFFSSLQFCTWQKTEGRLIFQETFLARISSDSHVDDVKATLIKLDLFNKSSELQPTPWRGSDVALPFHVWIYEWRWKLVTSPLSSCCGSPATCGQRLIFSCILLWYFLWHNEALSCCRLSVSGDTGTRTSGQSVQQSALVLECPVSTPVPHHLCWTYLTTEKRLALRCQHSFFAVAAVNMSASVNRLMKGEIWIPLPLISDFKAFASSFHGWMDDGWVEMTVRRNQ